MTNVQSGSFSGALKTYFIKRLLMRALPRFVHTRWGEHPVIGEYNTMEWRRYSGLSAVTSALTEGTTPAEQSAPSLTQVTATPVYYGAWLGFTDKMRLQSFDQTVMWMSSILGEQCGLSIDTIARNYLTTAANTTKLFSNGKTARTSLDAPGDNLGYKDLLYLIATLQAANVMPPNGDRFPVAAHPHSMASLYQDPTFVEAFIHGAGAGGDPMQRAYVGSFLNLDFYVSSNVREYADGGVGSTTDVYDLVAFGREAYGIAGVATLDFKEVDMGGVNSVNGLTGQTIQPVDLIIKELGSSGSQDALNQRGSVGWKTAFDTVTLNATFMVSMEHTNVFSDA